VETGFRKDQASCKKHDPEKWKPVFGKDHAPPQYREIITAQR
jgi:hypothetical protein